MTKGKLILFFLLLSNYLWGQIDNSFAQLFDKTNEYLNIYSELSPFDEYISVDELSIDLSEKKEIIAAYVDPMSSSPNKDSIESIHIIGHYQDKIFEQIQGIIEHKDFNTKDISSLFDAEYINSGLFSVVQSDDRKLFNFSLDEKMGGTYRSRITLVYFTELGKDSFRTDEENLSHNTPDPYAPFSRDGFSEAYSIHTKEGVKYVILGYVRGCSYCFENNIMLIKFEDGQFITDFAYSVNSRIWETDFTYDPIKKTIDISYETDDLTSECNCQNGLEENYSNEDEEFVQKKCACFFEFDGLNFELTKASWEKIKE